MAALAGRYPRLNLEQFETEKDIQVFFDPRVRNVLEDTLPTLGIQRQVECDVNAALYPAFHEVGIETPPTLLTLADKWCAWDEDLLPNRIYYLYVPEWSLFHRMTSMVGAQPIDLAPGVPDRVQTRLKLRLLAMPDVLYHLSVINKELEELKASQAEDRRRLNLLVEHFAGRDADLARVLGLTMDMTDLNPAAPHGHR